MNADLETLCEMAVLAAVAAEQKPLLAGLDALTRDSDSLVTNPHYSAAAEITGEAVPLAGIYLVRVVVELKASRAVEISEDDEAREPDPAAPTAEEFNAIYGELFAAVTVAGLMAQGFVGVVDMPQSTSRTEQDDERIRSFVLTLIAQQQPAS